MLYITSDTHFGHANIIRYCDRPFSSVEEMNEEIVRRFNSVLGPDDVLLHLGDVAMGNREKNLAYMKQIKCARKILKYGNHDDPWLGNPNEKRRERFDPIYAEAFDGHIYRPPVLSITDDETGAFIAWADHFPYQGASRGEERYDKWRYKESPDGSKPIIHGHTHSRHKVSTADNGSLQIHVGVDAWDFHPVPITDIEAMIVAFNHKKGWLS